MEASTERYLQANLGPLSGIISNSLGSVNSGTITVEVDRQFLLRLKINQNELNKINLEVGQKFMEILLEAFTGVISVDGEGVNGEDAKIMLEPPSEIVFAEIVDDLRSIVTC